MITRLNTTPLELKEAIQKELQETIDIRKDVEQRLGKEVEEENLNPSPSRTILTAQDRLMLKRLDRQMAALKEREKNPELPSQISQWSGLEE